MGRYEMNRVPHPPHKLRGHTKLAGMGYSTVIPDFDFETYSEAGYVWDGFKNRWGSPPGAPGTTRGLGVVGTPRYSEDPSTEVLTMAYDLKDGVGARIWVPDLPPPLELFEHLASGGLLEAWNVAFERLIWANVCRRRYGWPELPIRQLRCAQAKARAFGLPGKLALAGEVLRLDVQKDKEGERLLKLFSMPRNPTKANASRRVRLIDAPADADRLVSYNATDIAAEAAISLQVPDLEGDELEFWLADQAINARGVAIDREGVENCIAIIEQAHKRYNTELAELTGGAVMRASELAKLQQWLHGQGVHMDSMDEDAIEAMLKRLGDDVQDGTLDPAEIQAPYRALEIRQAVGSASVKKVFAMRLQCCADSRLRELFSYHAARTGRATGNGPQPTNLPKAGPRVYRCGCGRHSSPATHCAWCKVPRPPGSKTAEWCVEAAEDALQVIASRDLPTVQAYFGDAMLAVSGCLRSLFTASPGKELISSDFTAIEAVVLAALAGEQWRLDVFKAGTDIYLESISRSTGTLLQEMLDFKKERGMHHPLRQKGKVQELALGYGGWLGALKAFGAQGTDDEMKQQIIAWREASPAVVELWGGQSRDFGRVPGMFGLEGAAVLAIQNPGQWYAVPRLDGSLTGIAYGVKDDVLYCQLPSGRYLSYHRPRLSPSDKAWRGLRITFEGYNTNPKKGPPGWQTMDLYSGLLAENCVQAVARDILRHAMLGLERAGYPVVLHVYDEVVCEVPEGFGSVEELERIMATMPAWAEGWPIGAAGGWRGKRYRKG
jgi:DNA polymerase